MIDTKIAHYIHDVLIERYGGSKGIRDLGGLEAALARPSATFDQEELYPTAIDKAAAVFESIIINHPFIDGNKRTAYVMMRLILLSNNIDIVASQDEKYKMTISASEGTMGYEDIKRWLSERNKHINV